MIDTPHGRGVLLAVGQVYDLPSDIVQLNGRVTDPPYFTRANVYRA
jgi:hypothetical protein